MTTYFKDLQKHVVAYGNYALAAAGQPLFTKVGSGRNARLVYNVLPGQLVAYTVSNGVATTVDDATLAANHLSNLFIGVGHDSLGKGYTTDIRHIGIEGISGCLPEEAHVSSPRCGSPAVKDFYFSCTNCDETYSLMIGVDDNKTRSYSPFNKSFAEYVGSVVTNCNSCDDCPVEHNCKEIACKLADALNNEINLKIGDRNYPDWKGQGLPRPYFATRLHENSFIYCLAPQTDAEVCEDCTYLNAIKGVSIRGTRYNFSGNTNPLDATQTLPGQLDGIIAQINDAFITNYGGDVDLGINPHAGSAYATGSYQQCCSTQLHVNTCDATFTLYDYNDEEIAPTRTENPFTEYGTITPTNNCVDCGDVAVSAKVTLTFSGQPLDTETVTIGAKVYTFQAVLTNVDGNVAIGASAAESLENLMNAINLGAGAGTAYAAAMTVHPTVSAVLSAGTTMEVTAKTPGVAGNSIGSTETLTNGAFSAATLTGGSDAAAAASSVYNCGLRIIAEQVKGDCGLFLNQPLAFYGRRIEITPVGEGWRGKPWRIADVQAMELPAGFGSWIQWLEYQNTPEGTGRRYSRTNQNSQWLATPDKNSRVRAAVTAECDKNYCSYYLKTLSRVDRLNREFGYATIESTVHIPSTDATTVGAWEDFFDALLALNPTCKVLTATACDTSINTCA